MVVTSKEYAENVCGNMDINQSNVKIKEIKMAIITVGIQVEVFIAIIVASRDMLSKLPQTQLTIQQYKP
jgi:hypothetical protein